MRPSCSISLNDALTRRGHPAVAANLVRAMVGLGARAMIEEGLRRANAIDDVDRMLAEFLVHYENNIAAESRPSPLESLASAGALLAICTNKREYLTRQLLRALDLESRFQGIAGRDTFVVGKPDPAPLTGVIAAAGGHSARATMVGDSEVDVRTANAAAVPIVFVRFGYGEAPIELPPDAVIDHFNALGGHSVRLLRTLAEHPADLQRSRHAAVTPHFNRIGLARVASVKAQFHPLMRKLCTEL